MMQTTNVVCFSPVHGNELVACAGVEASQVGDDKTSGEDGISSSAVSQSGEDTAHGLAATKGLLTIFDRHGQLHIEARAPLH